MGNEYVQLLLFHVTTFTVLFNNQFALQLDKIILLIVVTLFFWTLVLIAIFIHHWETAFCKLDYGASALWDCSCYSR